MKNYLQNLWDNFEALLAEMAVKGENFFDVQSPHRLETTAIHQRKLAAVGGENMLERDVMLCLVEPFGC